MKGNNIESRPNDKMNRMALGSAIGAALGAVMGNGRLPYTAFVLLSLPVAVLSGILSLSQSTFAQPYLGNIRVNPAGFFQPFFGGVYPLLAITLVVVVGVASLGFLQSHGWFEIYTIRGSSRGIVASAIMATLFSVAVIVAEITNIIHMPADMNVPLPWSLLFYPVIAYVAEIVFHALPLALLLAVLGALTKEPNANLLVWLSILGVSLLEPIFHLRSGQPFSWAQAYIGLHIFAINFLQLVVFRRYDFISMYSFRLVYYMYWHIIWGYLRLQWLF